MQRRLVLLLVAVLCLASASFIEAQGNVTADLSCGQRASASGGSNNSILAGESFDSLTLEFEPLQATRNPFFIVALPGTDWISSGNGSISVQVSGCIDGSDSAPTISEQGDLLVIETKELSGELKVREICSVKISGDGLVGSSDFVVSTDLNVYVGFLAGTGSGSNFTNEGVDYGSLVAALPNGNVIQGLRLTQLSNSSGAQFNLDMLTLEGTPQVDVKANDVNLNLTMTWDAFANGSDFEVSISGCTRNSSVKKSADSSSDTTLEVSLGAVELQKGKKCTFEISSGNNSSGGSFSIPPSVIVGASAVFSTEQNGTTSVLVAGRSRFVSTNQLSGNLSLSPDSPPKLGGSVKSVELKSKLININPGDEGDAPKQRVYAFFEGFNTQNFSGSDFKLSISGCLGNDSGGDIDVDSDLDSSTGSLRLRTTEGFEFTDDECTFEFELPGDGLSVPDIGFVPLIVGIATAPEEEDLESSFDAFFGAWNYAEYFDVIYTMKDTNIIVSSEDAGAKLSSVKVEGTPDVDLSGASTQLALYVPKFLGFGNLQLFSVAVSGCASVPAALYQIPDGDQFCSYFALIDLPTITSGSKCTVEIKAEAAEGEVPINLGNPAFEGAVVSVAFDILQDGDFVAIGDQLGFSYVTGGGGQNSSASARVLRHIERKLSPNAKQLLEKRIHAIKHATNNQLWNQGRHRVFLERTEKLLDKLTKKEAANPTFELGTCSGIAPLRPVPAAL